MRKLNDGLNMKRVWRDACVMLAFLFFGAGCAIVGFHYAQLEMGGRLLGWSTSPDTAFMYGFPFMAVVIICIAVSIILSKKLKDE